MRNKYIKLLAVTMIISIFPILSHAATITVRPLNTFLNKDTNVLEVLLDTEGKMINVVEGNIQIVGQGKNIKSMNTGGSILSLWPTMPALSKDTISFVGGSTNSISGKNLPLFRIIISTGNEKSIQINLSRSNIYLNDGLGTKIAITNKPANIITSAENTTNTSQFENILLADRTPPEPFTIEIGKDNSLFNGNYFISFVTTDKESGMKYYEIIEGNNTPIRSSSPYMLQDQSLKSKITVKAYDYAGNVTSQTISAQIKTDKKIISMPSSPTKIGNSAIDTIMTFLIILILITAIITAVILFRKKTIKP